MKGKIVMDEDVPLRDPNMLNLVSEVSTRLVCLPAIGASRSLPFFLGCSFSTPSLAFRSLSPLTHYDRTLSGGARLPLSLLPCLLF
jgi:hypothetical protein